MATRTHRSVHHIGHLACGFRLNYIQEPANPPGSERTAQKIRRQEQGHQYAQEQLIEYARLFQYEAQPVGRRRAAAAGPAWLRWYPVFPCVLFVLTGASRARLDHRMSDLQAMVAQHPLVAALAREVRLGAAVLEDIEQHGPAQAVWVPLAGGKPRPWTEL